MMDFNLPLAVQIRKQISQALNDYNMIRENDRIMMCVSGGKDSSVLLALLKDISRRSALQFSVEAVMLDQKQPGFDAKPFRTWVESLDIPLKIIERNTYSVVKEKVTDGIYCSLCSRLRRGILYEHAFTEGFTKMALGHHREDLQETLLMNLFFTGKISAIPPKLLSDDKRNTIIRPLVYVAESNIESLAKSWNIPIIPCNLCGSQEGMKRKRIKKLLTDLEREIPEIRYSMATALGNVHRSQLLDKELWDFDTFTKKE